MQEYLKIQNTANLIVLLKQLAINLYVIEKNNLNESKSITSIDYINSNSISKFKNLNKNKYIN